MSARGGPVDVIVGIDIGLTCTGMERSPRDRNPRHAAMAKVSLGIAVYVNQAGWNGKPAVIQQWPGLKASRIPINANKVPTKVGYKAGEIGIDSWGFECPAPENIPPGSAVKDLFKFHLDNSFVGRKFQRSPQNAPKIENVKMWYIDFLTCLHTHIIRFLRERLRIDVNSTPTEFIFSIPTSWNESDLMVRCFRELVHAAGFEKAGNVIMELTEGEASAVFTAKHLGHKFQEGEVFIVCDAGGGTTDMCVLNVKSAQEETVELENLDDPQDQLRGIRGLPEDLIRRLAHQVTRGAFQTLKTGFGNPEVDLLKIHKLAVPNLDQQIVLSREELKAMFDSQIQQIIVFIKHQVDSLRSCRPNVILAVWKPCLILSGGLGSSKYVQDVIVKHFGDLRVLFAPDPNDLPLAVCKGLVIDRLQHFSCHMPVIPIRSSKASYGILCREIHNGKKHSGQPSTKNQLDGKKYARKQIDWLVRKGENPVRGGCVKRTYSLILDDNTTTSSWGFSIVCSTLEADSLPAFLGGKSGGASVLCHVISDPDADLPDGVSFQRRALLMRRISYSRIDCELSATIGVGKMEFTLKIFGEGEDTSQELKVRWEDSTRTAGRELDGLIRTT
ncbi:uncharacterized protein PAC_00273 [Phialocephala subalpina]|uniref:Hsp70 protein n=1 Tax=Phialocephala subalpina TaxID=576137 RepID=A0A1L7WC85_9HELO|nr:uncharacterized protein PAC_00273 [Phialocephala subalpina]